MRMGFVVIVLVVAGWVWKMTDEIGRSNRPESVVVLQPVMEDIAYERSHAFDYVSETREAMGMNGLTPNTLLERAAQNHADYLVVNHAKSHFETAEKPHFTGVAPVDRVAHTGYASLQVSENLSTHHHSAKDSVEGLFSAIYHRFAFLDPQIDEMGVGVTQDAVEGSNSAFVYVMGSSQIRNLCQEESFSGVGKYVYKVCADRKHRIRVKAFKHALQSQQQENPALILYPYDEEKEVTPVFYDEAPDPLPESEVSGFPVSVIFNPAFFEQVSDVSLALYKDQEKVPAYFMDKENDPHGRFSAHQFALFPEERLAYNTRYKVVLQYRYKGEEQQHTWHFSTTQVEETLYAITQSKQTIHIKAGSECVLYFKPKDAHDLLGNIHYPQRVSVAFLDHNTLKLSMLSTDADSFTIQTDRHRVKVIAEP